MVTYCRNNEIAVEASSPLGNGEILNNLILGEVAEKYKKSTAQICLRYALDKGLIVIPKTVNEERLKENIDVFNFSLGKEEIEIIDAMSYCGGIGIDSDEVTEFG